MAAAIEQLLDAFKNVNGKVSELLQPYVNITVDQAIATRPGIQLDQSEEATQKTWPVHRKWAQEFYRLRNDYVHGNDTNRRTWGWHPLEHLIMAAFVFPVLVKVLLMQEGHYQLTEDDEGRLLAIDEVLTITGWGQVTGTHSNATGWQETLRKSMRRHALELAVQTAIEDLKRQGIIMPEQESPLEDIP